MSQVKSTPVLPLGFAEQILQLQIQFQEEQSLEIMQILSKMYKIGLQYYLEHDVKKANYFQKKLNKLAVESLQAQKQKYQPARRMFWKKVKEQTQKFNAYNGPYIASLYKQSQKSQKKIKDCVQADLNRQEQRFQTKMLKRIKSTGKL